MFDLHESSDAGQVLRPLTIRVVSCKERLDVRSASLGDGLDMGYCLPTTDDRVALTMVFHSVEQIGEVSGSIGSGDIWHDIRLSDSKSNVKP